MVTPGSRLFLGIAAFGLVGAIVYGIGTGGDFLGTICLGWKGGVGEHLGYATFVTLFFAALGTAVVLLGIRDADPVLAADAPYDSVPEVVPPAEASPWPLVGAFGVVVGLLGLVISELLFVLGIVLVVIAIVEWAVQAWADRATGDPEVNRAIRNRLMTPIEIPVAAVLVIGFVVVGLSRLLLAVSAHMAVVIGTVILVLVVLGAVLAYSRPQHTRRIITVLLVLGALGVVAAGIGGIVAGEREVEEEPAAHGE